VKTLKRLLVAGALAVLALVATIFWSYGDVVQRFPIHEKVVALTFDDGPNPPHTQALLALLHKHQIKATFFLKGRNVEAFPELARTVALAGHEVGNHSYDHHAMFSFSKSAMREELVRTNAAIRAQLGYEPVLFRPPYLAQGPGLRLALADLEMDSILASDHGLDWEETDPQRIAGKVLSEIEPGAIILLHDGEGDVDDPLTQDSRAPTVEATALIIEALKARGFRFATVGDLMKES
jgi:peptidoglycan/xylan/chitin deacetylase (PgdA/CDA1 family)